MYTWWWRTCQGILENSTSDSIVIAIDQDKEAIEFAKKIRKYSDRVRIFRDNFRNLDTVIYLVVGTTKWTEY